MAKSSAFGVAISAALALLLLLVLVSYSPQRPHRHHGHRRLKLRSSLSSAGAGDASGQAHGHGHDHPQIPFDPVIAGLEQRLKDREWERAHLDIPHHAPGEEAPPEWEDFADAEDYINDENRFNITHRIVLLFPNIDVAPVDGFVSVEELTEWNLRLAEKEVMHRTEREMELHDKNRDGFVSFHEYEAPSWARQAYDEAGEDMGWWREDHFNASDVDEDGLLNKTEFNDFLHPADSSNPKLIHWLCKEEIRERDRDNDGKLNFQEFFNGLFDSIRDFDEIQNDSDSSIPAKNLFAQLDKDSDGFLSADEIKAVIGNLHPSERYYAKQAEYVLSQADLDKDGRLTLKEMIEHPYVFYSAIFSEDDEDDEYHDEFR